MTVEQAIQKAYGRSRGKDSLGTPLTAGDAKYNQLLDIADDKQKEWQNTDGINWQSLWQLFRLAAAVTATDTFALNALMRVPSDRENDNVVVTATNGQKYYYDIITADQLRERQIACDPTVCAIQGSNLVFARAFKTTDPMYGGTIDVPGYGFVTDINLSTTTATQKVQVDDPMWLVYAMAAEFVRTDLVRQNQYPNLFNLQSDRMDAMISNNGAQMDDIPIDMDLSDLDPNLSSGAWV
jgi:hypothetical protein